MSITHTRKKIAAGLLGMALMCLSMPQTLAAETLGGVPLGQSTIRVGLTPYADELATTALAEELLQKLGYTVTTQQVDIGIWFAGIAGGSMDIGFNAWLPITHGDYWKRYKDQLLDLGVVYEPTKQGWVVPDYVPQDALNSVADLKNSDIKEKLDNKITGISAGAGLMQQSARAMDAYGLSDAGYQLQPSSGAVMTASLARAIQRHEWIMVTGWSPHWMWQRFNLRYLNDTKNALGEGGKVHIVAGKQFPEQFPRAAAFSKQFHVPVTSIETIMNTADKLLDKGSSDSDEAYTQAARQYIDAHPELVKQWMQPAQKSATTDNAQAAG